jgi:hypothetical protein
VAQPLVHANGRTVLLDWHDKEHVDSALAMLRNMAPGFAEASGPYRHQCDGDCPRARALAAVVDGCEIPLCVLHAQPMFAGRGRAAGRHDVVTAPPASPVIGWTVSALVRCASADDTLACAGTGPSE